MCLPSITDCTVEKTWGRGISKVVLFTICSFVLSPVNHIVSAKSFLLIGRYIKEWLDINWSLVMQLNGYLFPEVSGKKLGYKWKRTTSLYLLSYLFSMDCTCTLSTMLRTLSTNLKCATKQRMPRWLLCTCTWRTGRLRLPQY